MAINCDVIGNESEQFQNVMTYYKLAPYAIQEPRNVRFLL